MPDWLQQIPEWLGYGLTGALGWCGHIGYAAWQKSRLPFRQDKERYDRVIQGVTRDAIYFEMYEPLKITIGGTTTRLSAIFHTRMESFENVRNFLMDIKRSPSYINKKLAIKEDALVDEFMELEALREDFIFLNTTYDDYSLINEDEQLSDDEIEKRGKLLSSHAQKVIAAYEDFRDYGNRYFAERVKERMA